MGGVVVRWVGIQALSDLTGLSLQSVKQKFAKSKTGHAFERGLCSNDEFISEFQQLFNLAGTHKELSELWNSWVQDPYEGIEKTISSLKSKYQIACLSNTNDLHWQHLKTYLNLDALFAPAYASHEIHLAKPDKACFEFVIANLNQSPKDILFLDDTGANVEAARSVGIQAHLVDPEFGAMPVLKSLGLI